MRISLLAVFFLSAGCSHSNGSSPLDATTTDSSHVIEVGGIDIGGLEIGALDSIGLSDGVNPGSDAQAVDMTGAVQTEFGAYKLLDQIDTSDAGTTGIVNGNTNCGTVLTGVARDFQYYDMEGDNGIYNHPDFDQKTNCMNQGGAAEVTGIVQTTLGSDGKPVLSTAANTTNTNYPIIGAAANGCVTSALTFNQWYHDVPIASETWDNSETVGGSATVGGPNITYNIAIQLVQNGSVYTFQSKNFFPLDAAGFDAMAMTPPNVDPGGIYPNSSDGKPQNEGTACTTVADCPSTQTWSDQTCIGGTCWHRNFGFTTEWHVSFLYQGGENFTFTGDDDVWVFINNQLVCDIGGIHGAVSKSVTVDNLGLTKGQNYPLDIFQAERHRIASTFRIDTTLMFTNCGSTIHIVQ